MPKLIILSIVYEEPEWQDTKKCIEDTKLPVHYVRRKPAGYGSLTEAINRGVREIESYDYVWIVTNVIFEPELPKRLLRSITGYSGIHPAFHSDHKHQVPDGSGEVKDAPFIEFTAPLIRLDALNEFPLDEMMPYWGQDLDFSYRVWKAGGKLGVDHGATIGHTYIRNKKLLPITSKRLMARKMTNLQTQNQLRRKYGNEWRSVVFPKTERDIKRFYEQVKESIINQ